METPVLLPKLKTALSCLYSSNHAGSSSSQIRQQHRHEAHQFLLRFKSCNVRRLVVSRLQSQKDKVGAAQGSVAPTSTLVITSMRISMRRWLWNSPSFARSLPDRSTSPALPSFFLMAITTSIIETLMAVAAGATNEYSPPKRPITDADPLNSWNRSI